MGDMSVEVAPRERAAGGRRAAAAKIKYSQSGSESDSDMSLHSNDGVDEPSLNQGEISVLDDSVMSVKKEVDIGDTDSEFEEAPKPKKPKAAPKPKASPPKPSADDLFTSAFGGSPGSDSGSAAPAPKAAKPKKEKAPKEDKPKK